MWEVRVLVGSAAWAVPGSREIVQMEAQGGAWLEFPSTQKDPLQPVTARARPGHMNTERFRQL